MENAIPKKIGRYAIHRVLGAGAMGQVYLGRDPKLDRAVAIKTIRSLSLPPESMQHFLERFRNEARAAAQLQHPSIVQVYDVGEDPRVGTFLVFEYVAGSTLKEILRSRGALNPDEVVRMAEEVGGALEAAHAQGIIHRDIKPENLLVTPDGRVKLADFGVARVPNASLTREGQFLGTPCYAAPETLDRQEYSPRSDQFSLAALLYEAVCGVRAFPGTEAIAVAHDVIHKEPPIPSEVAEEHPIPAAVDSVIMRGLAKDPTARWASPLELAKALHAAYEGEGALGSVASRTSLGAWVYGLFALVAIVVGVLLVVLLSGTSDGQPVTPALDAALIPVESDAHQPVVQLFPWDAAIDAGDAAMDAALLGLPSAEQIAAMARPDREEAAKEALRDVSRLKAVGDLEGARRALELARLYDPEHPDIVALSRELERR